MKCMRHQQLHQLNLFAWMFSLEITLNNHKEGPAPEERACRSLLSDMNAQNLSGRFGASLERWIISQRLLALKWCYLRRLFTEHCHSDDTHLGRLWRAFNAIVNRQKYIEALNERLIPAEERSNVSYHVEGANPTEHYALCISHQRT